VSEAGKRKGVHESTVMEVMRTCLKLLRRQRTVIIVSNGKVDFLQSIRKEFQVG
jgi:hypothetical protein